MYLEQQKIKIKLVLYQFNLELTLEQKQVFFSSV